MTNTRNFYMANPVLLQQILKLYVPKRQGVVCLQQAIILQGGASNLVC